MNGQTLRLVAVVILLPTLLLPFVPLALVPIGLAVDPSHWLGQEPRSFMALFVLAALSLFLVVTPRVHPVIRSLAVLGFIPALLFVSLAHGILLHRTTVCQELHDQHLDHDIGRVQVVHCYLIMFNWYRVQQYRNDSPFGRRVATFFIGQDDRSPPVGLRFNVSEEADWLIMREACTMPCPVYRRPFGQRLALFRIAESGRLHYEPILSDRSGPTVWPTLHATYFESRDAEIAELIASSP